MNERNSLNDLQLAVQALLDSCDEYQGAVVTNVVPMVGDMSSRRYCRVELTSASTPTLILMLLSSAPGPLGGGARSLTQDDTFVEISWLLLRHGVKVPRIVVDARDSKMLLVEDFGSITLHGALTDRSSRSIPAALATTPDPLGTLFERALSILKPIRTLTPTEESVIFQRRTTPEQRRLQIREFLDHYATPRGFSAEGTVSVERLMSEVCARVELHPVVVSHYDFMPANLHVLPSGEVGVIDFQDMCLDSPARDVVSLLNDRGTDELLGAARHARLLQYYFEKINELPDFAELYQDYLLLWDFRVSGRFALLSEKRGIARYAEWIPETLRRLGRTLKSNTSRFSFAEEALTHLCWFSSEIREGAQSR
jgi:N-acetylmuramate 1-kinase